MVELANHRRCGRFTTLQAGLHLAWMVTSRTFRRHWQTRFWSAPSQRFSVQTSNRSESSAETEDLATGMIVNDSLSHSFLLRAAPATYATHSPTRSFEAFLLRTCEHSSSSAHCSPTGARTVTKSQWIPSRPVASTSLAQVWRSHTGIDLEDTIQYTLGTSISRGTGLLISLDLVPIPPFGSYATPNRPFRSESLWP